MVKYLALLNSSQKDCMDKDINNSTILCYFQTYSCRSISVCCSGVDHLHNGHTEVDPEAIHVDKSQAPNQCNHISCWNTGKQIGSPQPTE